MKMRNKLITIILLLSNTILFAQGEYKGQVLDKETEEPIPFASIHLFTSEADTVVWSNQNGEFVLPFDIEEIMCVDINREYYRILNICFDEEVLNSFDGNFYMLNVNSEPPPVEDIAEEDWVDFVLGAEVFAPGLTSSDDKFKSTFSVYYAYEGRVKIADKMQLGVNLLSLKLKWINMEVDDQITTEPHEKERYFETSVSLGGYYRYIISTTGQRGTRGAFIDLGASYAFPLYFGYTYFPDKHIKTSQNRIHNFLDFQGMMRIGYGSGSIKATYRFTDILKGAEFIQPPKLTIGVEANISLM